MNAINVLSSLGWFPLALVAFVCYGVQNFLYKSAAIKGMPSSDVLIVFSTFAGVICACLVPFAPIPDIDWIFLIAISLASAITFSLTIISRLEALKQIDGAVVFPIVRMQSAILFLYAVFVLGEVPNQLQLLGVAFAVGVIVLSFEKPQSGDLRLLQRKGFGLAILAMLTSAANVLICRSAAKNADITLFFVFSFLLTALITRLANGKPVAFGSFLKPQLLQLGVAIAICNVLGAYALLTALREGPLFAVTTIYNQSFVISIVLVIVLHKERFTSKRAALLVAAMLSLVLLES